MHRTRAIWGAAVLALLAPLCSQAGDEYGRYAIVVNTLWPSCERMTYTSPSRLEYLGTPGNQSPANCTPELHTRPNPVGLVALGALQFSNKPQWAREVNRLRREGLRLASMNTRSTTFYVGINPEGVAGVHFVGTMSR